MKTYNVKLADIENKWYVIDAKDLILGRLAVEIARLLSGKHKPSYTPHLDCGDHVIIVNAEKIHLTGKKVEQKEYFWHTGFPGGIKQRTVKAVLASRFPERIIEKAVQRMLNRAPLGRQQLRKLHVYAGSEHPHQAQTPVTIDFGARNRKNKKAEK